MTLVRRTRPEDLAAARELLSGAGLPLEGVDEHFAAFLVVDDPDGQPAALVGAERYGERWLLRSLAVDAPLRGRGHGRTLVEAVLAEARDAGATEVFLLTTDAQAYFARHGFQEHPRAAAPPALHASAELRGACPETATLMRLEIAS